MNALIESSSNIIRNPHFAALFLDTLLKSFVMLALAGGVCALWRRSSAATRHLVWLLAVVSLPCLPLLTSTLPLWQGPLWSVSTGFDSGNRISLALELAPGTFAPKAQTTAGRVEAPAAARHAADGSRKIAARFSTDWMMFGLAVWSAGVALVLIFTAIGQFRLRKFSRRARPLQNADWALLLKEACATLRLQRAVVLLQSADDVLPMTWGWWRPVVLLPAEAGEWPTDRRRIVLLHELAHVKRWDWLTQWAAKIVCALYWFNPLVWLAARQMCVERERACDDLVLNGGCKASDYAGHLVEIAGRFRYVPQVAAIAMARSSQLAGRITAIVDGSRSRRLRAATALAILALVGGITLCLGGNGTNTASRGAAEAQSLREQQIQRLEAFSTEKEKQSHALAAKAGEKFFPGFQPLFTAATKGDWQTVTNLFESFKRRYPQYEKSTGDIPHVTHWAPVLEVSLAYESVVICEPKYTQIEVDEIINSIPAGSIYFGGTDPGRALPTAFCKSHADADPFFTLTQNALADGTYLNYLRLMYGGKIYTPTTNNSQQCFQDYVEDAQKRLQNHQLKPGENFRTDTNGHVQISGQVAVMMINGLLAKIIFDKNPGREFYVEESFPLDWMYPYLEPHGLIFKLNRQPAPAMSDEIIRRDHDYWTKCVAPMIGDWLNDDTPVSQAAAFVEKVQLKQNFDGFKGDPRFVQNNYAGRMFSKLRDSIGGVYAWHVNHAANEAEKVRMARAADFAFRQAWALCPYNPEAVYRYVNFLQAQNRNADALLVAETTAKFPSQPGFDAKQMQNLVDQLKQYQKAK